MNDLTALLRALRDDDLDAVRALVQAQPTLQQAPVGYAQAGLLTWVAECRSGPPSAGRLALARWLVEQGADIHQGGDAPLMRAALRGERLPMMALLVALGADVNARFGDGYPMLFAPCETVDPVALGWLLDHGAAPGDALDHLLGGYQRSPQLPACIERLLAAGATSRRVPPPVLALLRGRLGAVADPALLHHHWDGLDIGASGARRLTLDGGTLLHVAAEFGLLDAAHVLLARGADVNAPGRWGQTPIFHSVSQFDDAGLAMTELLIAHGAQLAVRARLPGHFERPSEMVDATPLAYAEQFPGPEFPGSNGATLALLRR